MSIFIWDKSEQQWYYKAQDVQTFLLLVQIWDRFVSETWKNNKKSISYHFDIKFLGLYLYDPSFKKRNPIQFVKLSSTYKFDTKAVLCNLYKTPMNFTKMLGILHKEFHHEALQGYSYMNQIPNKISSTQIRLVRVELCYLEDRLFCFTLYSKQST